MLRNSVINYLKLIHIFRSQDTFVFGNNLHTTYANIKSFVRICSFLAKFEIENVYPPQVEQWQIFTLTSKMYNNTL